MLRITEIKFFISMGDMIPGEPVLQIQNQMWMH